MRADTWQAIKALHDSAITIGARTLLAAIDARREFHKHLDEDVDKMRRAVEQYLRK